MIVNVSFVNVGTDDKGMITFQEPFGKFITDTVCFFRRNLTRLERLPDLISDYVAFLIATGDLVVFFF